MEKLSTGWNTLATTSTAANHLPPTPPSQPPAPKLRTAQQWFNPCAYSTPATGTLGNAGRNILQDQTYWDLDASIFRIFPISERVRLKGRS